MDLRTGQPTTQKGRSAIWPSLYGVKPAFVAALSPVRRMLIQFGVTPNQLSFCALPLQIGIAVALVAGSFDAVAWLTIPLLAFALMAVNALDGSLARETGSSTAWGAVANELIDRFGDLVIFAAAMFAAPGWASQAALIAVIAAELCATVGWAVTGVRQFPGPMGKPDRMLVLSLGAAASVLWPLALPVALGAIAIGAALGSFNRARIALNAARAMDVDAHDC